jgi:hypothetical protein
MEHVGADGPLAHRENRGNLGMGVTLHVKENDCDSLPRGQADERAREIVREFAPFGVTIRRLFLSRDGLIEGKCPANRDAPEATGRGVDHDPHEPRRKWSSEIKSGEAAQGRKERILGCIIGFVRVPEDRHRDPSGLRGIPLNQVAKRSTIAGEGPLHQDRIVVLIATRDMV